MVKHVWDKDRLQDYETRYTSWVVYNKEEHQKVFNELSAEWFKQWPLSEDFKGFNPHTKDILD